MKETDPRFIYLQKKIGIFFLVALIGIVITIAFIGIERDVFTPKYRIYFTVNKGTGFFEGMSVKLSGFKIGKIESLALDENAKVKITLLINEKYQKWIREDSKATLLKEGFIGESIIDVSVGSSDKPVIEDDGIIRYEKARGLDEIIEEVRPMVGEIRDIVHYINDPQGDIKQTLKNIQILSADLHETRKHIDDLLKNANNSITYITADVSKIASNANSIIEKTDKAVEKIGPVIDKLDRTMDNAEKTTTALKNAVEDAAPRVPLLLDQSEDTLNDTGEVVKSLKKIWPIRLFIEEPQNDIFYGNSYE